MWPTLSPLIIPTVSWSGMIQPCFSTLRMSLESKKDSHNSIVFDKLELLPSHLFHKVNECMRKSLHTAALRQAYFSADRARPSNFWQKATRPAPSASGFWKEKLTKVQDQSKSSRSAPTLKEDSLEGQGWEEIFEGETLLALPPVGSVHRN